jgi:hypothetical protein
MTKEQIEILRGLIQGEIEAAIQNENGYRFAFAPKKANDQGWETFMNTFIKQEETEWTETGSGV